MPWHLQLMYQGSLSVCVFVIKSSFSWVGLMEVCLMPQDCPLLLVLNMFELCCDCRNFSEARLKLEDFQKTLLTVRKQQCGPSSPEVISDWFL